jgi:hypothetical protein
MTARASNGNGKRKGKGNGGLESGFICEFSSTAFVKLP